jgi:DNA-directed RNA polymerase subunit RPC12/RpoP
VSRKPEIAFRCKDCGREATAGLDGHGRCAACGAETDLTLSPSLREAETVDVCPACDSTLLYVQRDFNQKAGLGIVIIGGVLAPFTPYYSSLIVAALIDTALYLLLPEITVCYRCHAHFRGFQRNPKHAAFDLHLAEQYDVHK